MIRAPIRLALLAAWAIAWGIIALVPAILTLGSHAAFARTGPVLMKGFSKGICAILGIRIERSGEPPPHGACFVAPNHWSYVDVFVLGSLYRSLFVSRADVAGWPVVGLFARAGGTLFLRREIRRDAARVGGDVEQHLRGGRCVTAFLEGGAGRGDEVRPFKSALAEAPALTGAPCVPVALRYTLPLDPALDPGTVVAWIDDDFVAHAWRLMRTRRVCARVTFLPPRSGADRKELARLLERDVRAAIRDTPA